MELLISKEKNIKKNTQKIIQEYVVKKSNNDILQILQQNEDSLLECPCGKAFNFSDVPSHCPICGALLNKELKVAKVLKIIKERK